VTRPEAPETAPDISYDAVVVVPGIMGSALVSATSPRKPLWGFKTALRYSKLWVSGSAYKRLVPTPAEIAGTERRVVPAGVLQMPAAAPILRGIEGYGALIDGVRGVVADKAAVLEFAYDWRLSVEHNSRCLARAARTHLDEWRRHEVHKKPPTRPQPRLVIVAHSMGGLLTRALSLVEGSNGVPDVTKDIRAAVTVGTPFLGSVKAATLLASGAGVPKLASRKRMKALAIKLPGVYDLVPMYRCVKEGEKLRRFSPEDVENIGGNGQLAEAAIDFNRRLLKAPPIPGHRAKVGIGQSTFHSLSFDSGELVASEVDFEWSGDKPALDEHGRLCPRAREGDGTVGRDNASLKGIDPDSMPQQHGALVRSRDAVESIVAIITERELGDRQGEGNPGIDVPDVVSRGEEWEIVVSEVDGPTDATCEVRNVDTPAALHDEPALEWRDGRLVAATTTTEPGVYRVELSTGGWPPVSQLVLVG
jgi:hypothetical protein